MTPDPSFRLPPLNALKTFEAAARHLSFARAAEELHVTPGAISRQIRSLEDTLGFALFERGHREVRLTAGSEAYVKALSDSFRQMERATRQLVRRHGHPLLHVHIAITFTLRWLVPRLAAFHARYPRQQIRLSTDLPDFAELAASTDVSLRMTSSAALEEHGSGLVGHRLFDIELVPVCSPAYLQDYNSAEGGNIFRQGTLLHSRARPQDWASWLNNAGLRDVDAQAGISFESSSLAYQAALEGVGIAISMRPLVEADLRAERLVAPHSFVHRTESGFYLLYGRAAADHGAVAQFRDWLLEGATTP